MVITPSSTRPQPKGLRERLDHRHTEHGAGGACWRLPDARGGHRIASLAEARSEELLVPSFLLREWNTVRLYVVSAEYSTGLECCVYSKAVAERRGRGERGGLRSCSTGIIHHASTGCARAHTIFFRYRSYESRNRKRNAKKECAAMCTHCSFGVIGSIDRLVYGLIQSRSYEYTSAGSSGLAVLTLRGSTGIFIPTGLSSIVSSTQPGLSQRSVSELTSEPRLLRARPTATPAGLGSLAAAAALAAGRGGAVLSAVLREAPLHGRRTAFRKALSRTRRIRGLVRLG